MVSEHSFINLCLIILRAGKEIFVNLPLFDVLVVAIMFRQEKVSLQCRLLCSERRHVSRASVDIHWDHFGFPYGTADVSCPLPPACQAPSHVAVTSAAARNRADLEFLEVQNQKELNVFPYNFTSCFSTMYNYTNILQLVQTVEMLQLLGVNRIVIYKTNCSVETQRVLDYYTDKGLVEVVPWSLSEYLKVSRRAKPDQDPGDIHYYGQIPALNDCLYRSMYRSKYVALHDPDELILPQTKRHGADRCFYFENNWFPTEFTLPPPPPNVLPARGLWRNVSGANVLTHLYSEPVKPKPAFNNFKTITNPRSVFVVTVHGVLRSQKNVQTLIGLIPLLTPLSLPLMSAHIGMHTGPPQTVWSFSSFSFFFCFMLRKISAENRLKSGCKVL
uniref:Glycosyltransferase family 92 protein n=1 Tax=Xiphophorus couchianus TaxID=32473 RepID=A0A3B5KS38_9TELE